MLRIVLRLEVTSSFTKAFLDEGPFVDQGSSFPLVFAQVVEGLLPFRDKDFIRFLQYNKPSSNDTLMLGPILTSKVCLTAVINDRFGGPESMVHSLELEAEIAEGEENNHVALPV